jgi:hypothetical protein
MTIVKKFAIIIMLGIAFIWLVHTIMVFNVYRIQWGELQVGTNILISQIVFFLLKNIPTVIAVALARKWWN